MEQEAEAPRAPAEPGDVDLRAVILPAQTDRVTVSVPAQAVLVKQAAADELASATRAALDNVRQHCGERTRSWVLVEDEPGLVTVTMLLAGLLYNQIAKLPGPPQLVLAFALAAAAGSVGAHFLDKSIDRLRGK